MSHMKGAIMSSGIVYTPWLDIIHRFTYYDWCDSTKEPYVCCDKLRFWFDLPSLEESKTIQIRLRISNESQGNDYQIQTIYNPGIVRIYKNQSFELVALFDSLMGLIYQGCWIGLETRHRDNQTSTNTVPQKNNVCEKI